MVTLGRFELPTSGLGNRCSIQLSYRATSNMVSRGKPLDSLFSIFSDEPVESRTLPYTNKSTGTMVFQKAVLQ
jgi:hypothetical protein